MVSITPGATNKSVDIFIQDSSSSVGAGLTGLVYNSSGLTCYYRKGATGTLTALSLATQTVGGAHSDGGFVEIDATNAPGLYRLDLSDTIVATGSAYAMLYLQGATNMAPTILRIDLESRFAIPDETLKRAVSNVENDCDKHSLGAVVMISTNSSIAGGVLTAKKPSDDSTFQTYTVTTSSSANNITSVS